MVENLVKIDIVSQAGHDELMLEPSLALAELKRQTSEQNKWCLVDGKVKNADVLTQADIVAAKNIVLTDKMIGG
jgi:hypothetical protein